MFWVYVLRSEVTGRRNSGQSPATRHGVPWTLVYREGLETKVEAVRRELYFKTGKGRDELDRILRSPSPG